MTVGASAHVVDFELLEDLRELLGPPVLVLRSYG
jgi:hypothetical protein